MFATNSINNKPRSISSNNNNKYNNPINNEIKFKEFTLIDSDGQNLGITKRDVALRLAQDKNLDLVLISNKVPNVVCKIMDYGKYVYDQQRKAKDSKKNQKKIKVKEVKVKPTIGDNDLSWNADHIKEWIADGDVVRIVVNAKGRMLTKKELIYDVFNKLLTLVGDVVTVRSPLKMVSPTSYEGIIEPKKGK